MACHLGAAIVDQLRALGAAAVVRVWAARIECATGRRVQRIGYLAAHRRAGATGVVHLGNRIQQHAGVRVARSGKQLLLVGDLHQATEIHHAHLIAHVPHDGQVVADEQIGQLPLALQVLHDVQHLRLHRHVECRGGLVAHEKFRLGGQRAGNRNALALAARELVRVLGHVGRRQAHRLQQLSDAPIQRILVRNEAMLDQRLGNDVAHQPAWVEAGVGVLENHLDAPPHGAHVAALECRMGVLAIKVEVAARRLIQSHEQSRHRAFAAARFTDQGQRLAFLDLETHTVDGMQHGLWFALEHAVEPGGGDVKGLGQIHRADQGLCRRIL